MEISASTVNGFIESIEKNRKIKYKKSIEYAIYKDLTELPLLHRLISVELDSNTRTATITLSETKGYRAIERYIRRFFKKEPVYSDDWTSEEKTVKKSIELTNRALEELNHHQDPLIKEFAHEIVAGTDNPELFPSWFLVDILKFECETHCKKIRDCFEQFKAAQHASIQKIASSTNSTSDDPLELLDSYDKKNSLIKEIEAEMSKCEKRIDEIRSEYNEKISKISPLTIQ